MFYLVKVRVDGEKLADFGRALRENRLDRSLIRSETFCVRADPAAGFSVWEADSRNHLDEVLGGWLPYYAETDVVELITPAEAMKTLMTVRQ